MPARYASADGRGTIQIALNTHSLDVAKLRRDSHELADNLYWQSLATGETPESAQLAYDAARARAGAIGFEYRTAGDLAAMAAAEDILHRLAVAHVARLPDARAVTGTNDQPKVSVKKAMEKLVEEIAIGDTKGMSEPQKRKWTEQKTFAATSFTAIVGERALLDVTREDANKFHQHWMDRVMGVNEKPISGNTANRVIGNLRKLFRDYTAYLGVEMRNPFEGKSFPDKKARQKERPPFPTEWISNKILQPLVHDGLNDEARAIMFVAIETGCRPSEICNLRTGDIHTRSNVPYISIRHQEDRVIKTDSSERDIPLIGIALEAMRRFPNGFPRYRNKETSLSATLMKHLRAQKLLPGKDHSVYSFRHSFEKRMLEAGLDVEFRKRTMGHSIEREEYGDGGSMAWRRDQLVKIVLPFDAAIVI